jgi:crossover junction endodeoxyribonuclease RusA
MTDKNQTGYLLHLPFPPSVNSYYGLNCNGRAPRKYIKEAGKQYRQKVQEIIQEKDLELRANIPLSVTVSMTVPDKRLHDIDNILKCLFDSLTHANFWQDDLYVRKLHMDYSGAPSKHGSVLVYIEAL